MVSTRWHEGPWVSKPHRGIMIKLGLWLR